MIDYTKVFPRIKEIYKDGESPKSLVKPTGKTIDMPFEASPVMQPLAKNLNIAYALDMGSHYQFIPNRDLSDEVTIEKLHEAALSNMINEIKDNIQAHGSTKEVMMITNGGNYEAAMLIWEDVWPQIESMAGGEVYVAVPARDLLYVAPQNNPNAIEQLSKLIRKLFDEDEEAQGLLVRHIYQKSNKGWEVVTTA